MSLNYFRLRTCPLKGKSLNIQYMKLSHRVDTSVKIINFFKLIIKTLLTLQGVENL